MKPCTLETKIWKEPEDIDVTIEFIYHGAHFGSRDSLGVPLEPDEPAFVDICSIRDINGDEIEVDDKEYAELEKKCIEEIERERDF